MYVSTVFPFRGPLLKGEPERAGPVKRWAALGIFLVAAFVLFLFWLGLRLGGEALGAQRWFVWAVFILVDIYSTVMVAIFWTYANDVVSRTEADKLYGPIGVGGILGGVVG